MFSKRGARPYFVERNPVFALACRLRGYRGRCFDAVRDRRLLPDWPDVVYAHGSFTSAYFTGPEDVADWLALLERAPLVILTPWLSAPAPAWFTRVFADRGYASTGWIEGYSVPDIYPEAWLLGIGAEVRTPVSSSDPSGGGSPARRTSIP